MNVAFFGSPKLSVDLLIKLLDQTEITINIAVTQPDKPAGKHLDLTQTPLKAYAQKKNIQVFDLNLDEKNTEKLIQLLRTTNTQLGIVLAYGAIIPKKILDSTKYGFWNVHPSLLPKYRGAAPTVFPIAMGDKTTGISLMQMNEFMDKGDIISQKKLEIHDSSTRLDIESQIAPIAADMINISVLELKSQKPLITLKQDDTNATYTRRIQKDDGFIPLNTLKLAMQQNKYITGEEIPHLISSFCKTNNIKITQLPAHNVIWNMYGALISWPGIWTLIKVGQDIKRLQITNATIDNNCLKIIKVKLEGKKEVNFIEFNNAYNIF